MISITNQAVFSTRSNLPGHGMPSLQMAKEVCVSSIRQVPPKWDPKHKVLAPPKLQQEARPDLQRMQLLCLYMSPLLPPCRTEKMFHHHLLLRHHELETYGFVKLMMRLFSKAGATHELHTQNLFLHEVMPKPDTRPADSSAAEVQWLDICAANDPPMFLLSFRL